jgi:hypothetical protein
LALYQTSNFLYVVRQLISFPFQWSIDLLFGFIGSSLSCTCQATLPFFVKRFEASTGLAKRRQLRTWMIHEWYMNDTWMCESRPPSNWLQFRPIEHHLWAMD